MRLERYFKAKLISVCMMRNKNRMCKTNRVIRMYPGDILTTIGTEDSSWNNLDEIIRMIIFESIINRFKVIFFNIKSSYDIIINRQTPLFMYELNVKYILTWRFYYIQKGTTLKFKGDFWKPRIDFKGHPQPRQILNYLYIDK